MDNISVLYSFPLRMGVSGIGMTAWYQVSSLANQGIKVSLFCGSCEKKIQGVEYVRETLRHGSIPLPIRLIGRNRACVLHDWIVARFLRGNYGKFDIVHCWPSGSLETLKSAKSLGVRTVLERPSAHTRFVYEITTRECERLGITLRNHYSLFDPKRLAREENEFSITDKILCPSKHVMATFIERGFNEDQLLLGGRGYDPAFFYPAEESGSENNMYPFFMVYVGECHPLKGLHFALQAWIASKASKKGRFYICGNFLPEYRKTINAFLTHPSVKYLGFVRDVAGVMRRCNALVLPSLSEGFPKVTCEARACGCILLVSDAASEACEHMKNGLVHKAGNIDSLRQHIDLLASNENLRKSLRSNSLATVSDFMWENLSKELIKVYLKCIDYK